jgi:hypothetical protein
MIRQENGKTFAALYLTKKHNIKRAVNQKNKNTTDENLLKQYYLEEYT